MRPDALWKRWPTALSLVGLLLLSAPAAAQVPPQIQGMLLLRSLTFDRALPGRAGEGALKIAVVFRPGEAASESAGRGMLNALKTLSKKGPIGGRPVQVLAIPYSTEAELEAEVKENGVHAAYLAPNLEKDLGAIRKVAVAQSVLTFTGTEPYVTRGASIGLVLRETKAGILVHLPSARAEGADLDSGLLRIAEVIK